MLQRNAFTLVELLVAVMISSMLVLATTQVYSLFNRALNQDSIQAEAAQNGRVALDRLSRDLRQANALVTNLPETPNDLSVAQPHEVEFEDGHANDLTYKRYYLNGTVLQMQIKEYYFASDPGVRVKWNSVGTGGEAPVAGIISTLDIADLIQSLNLYGSDTLQISLTTGQGTVSYALETSVDGRNR